MQLTQDFVRNIQAAYGDEGKVWLQTLPQTVLDLTQKGAFQVIGEFSSLSFSYVARVKLASTGETAILKMAPSSGPTSQEIRWLNHFADLCPKVLWTSAEQNAFLMQECTPGTSLKHVADDATATRILCSMIKNLADQRKKHSSYKHLSGLISDFNNLKGILDPSLLSKATGLFKDLTQDRSQDILLHGDLHHDNILSHENAWKVIDPHGYMGDPASEIGVLFYNPMERLVEDKDQIRNLLGKRMRIAEENLPFDKKKIRAWAFCKAVLSAAWNAKDFRDLCETQLDLARTIATFL